MQTSYFAKYKEDNGVSIARWKPNWYDGRYNTRLAPTEEMVRLWKAGKLTEETYTSMYCEDVLKGLSAKKVYAKYKDCVLLCYEKTGDFCHRRILAKWLEEELGVEITEYN